MVFNWRALAMENGNAAPSTHCPCSRNASEICEGGLLIHPDERKARRKQPRVIPGTHVGLVKMWDTNAVGHKVEAIQRWQRRKRRVRVLGHRPFKLVHCFLCEDKRTCTHHHHSSPRAQY